MILTDLSLLKLGKVGTYPYIIFYFLVPIMNEKKNRSECRTLGNLN